MSSARRETAQPAWGERQRLVALTVPMPAADPFTLLRLARGAPRLFWREPGSRVTTVGLGAAQLLRADGPLRVARLQLQMDHLFEDALLDLAGPPEATPRLFGGLAFSPTPKVDAAWADFGPACFILPHLTVTFTAEGNWLTLCRNSDADALRGDPLASLRDEAEAFLAGVAEAPSLAPPSPHATTVHAALTQDAWRGMVDEAVRQIRAGGLKKVVLSRALDVESDWALDAVAALERLDARFPDTYRFLFEPAGGAAFIGASPELLAEVRESVLHTAALAGSRPRGATEAQDAALAQELMASAKEREEHQIVVESVLARVTPYARQVDAPPVPGILRLRNIQHLHTPVSAELESHFDALDLVGELHPTPALGGFPQRAALAFISEHEPVERGWFAAPVGWIDADGDGLFAVAIRSAVLQGPRARLYAGAGIVAESAADQEWAETGLKFRPLLGALGVEEGV
jgi:menaquinone-specific isochorismate synthase